MLVLSSPSGAGKTSIARRLLDEDDNLTLSVSPRRAPRPNEVDGRDYHFVDQGRFDQMVAEDEFLEYATVFSHSYGTPKADVMAALARGADVLFDIDWQGTQQVANAARTDLVSVFILPPSREALHQRLVARAQDSADVVAARMAKASDEISHYREYDYIVVNEDLDRSVESVRAILSAERLRRDRQAGMTGLSGRFSPTWKGPRRPVRVPVCRKPRCRGPAAALRVDAGGLEHGLAADGFRDTRSILRRWPKASRVTSSSAPRSQGWRGCARGLICTTDEVTFGAGTKASGGISNRMAVSAIQPVRMLSRP